jgi:hypothetical protein
MFAPPPLAKMNPLTRPLQLVLLPQSFAIARLSPAAPTPEWATRGAFFSVSRSEDELSIVTEAANVPAGIQSQAGWRVLKVQGPFVLSEVGVLASLASPIAEAGASLFAISTFDTDYLLIGGEQLEIAASALEHAGHKVLKLKQNL